MKARPHLVQPFTEKEAWPQQNIPSHSPCPNASRAPRSKFHSGSSLKCVTQHKWKQTPNHRSDASDIAEWQLESSITARSFKPHLIGHRNKCIYYRNKTSRAENVKTEGVQVFGFPCLNLTGFTHHQINSIPLYRYSFTIFFTENIKQNSATSNSRVFPQPEHLRKPYDGSMPIWNPAETSPLPYSSLELALLRPSLSLPLEQQSTGHDWLF